MTRLMDRKLRILFLILICICALSVEASIVLKDVTKQTNIDFKHSDGSGGNYYIMESMASGLALFDYDSDGDIDIYFLNGSALKGTTYIDPPKNQMYRNDGNFKFTNVTEQTGLGDTGFGLAVAVADYDNDGYLDIYINNFGANVLYRNNGNGTFTDVAAKASVTDGHHIGAGTSFLDMDKDGDLDLYVSRYVKFTYDNHLVRKIGDYHGYVSPTVYKYTPDALYRNNGNGTFTDVSVASGIAQYPGSGMGTICADYDNDGDTDIFVANDVNANFLFQNDGTGKFEEVGLMAGFAYDIKGKALGSMGVTCADYDNDGWLDFYVTSYANEWTTLYKNLGDGILDDVTFMTKAGEGTYNAVTWGTAFVDFDNDADHDIFVAAGHNLDTADKFTDSTTYLTKNMLLMNTGDGKFVNISKEAGDGLQVKLSSRGAVFDDLDNDGDIDGVILNSRAEPTILRNDSVNDNHWIDIRLRGVKTNRNGIGARVKVVSGDRTQIDEVHSGRGYQGHYGLRLHFGLGDRKKIDRIEVTWIGGKTDIIKNVKVDQRITIVEGGKIEKQR